MTSGDWEEGAIGSLFSFHRTVALSRAQLSDNAEIGYIHYGDIHAKWGTHLDLSRESLPRAEARLAASATPVADGDLVLADASEDIEGVGRAVEICGVGQQRVVAGLHTVLLRPRAGVFAPRYGGLLPETPEFRVQARTLAAGLKVYGLSKSSIKQIVVRVPPLKEQEAIAEALVDSDAAIEALDALIARKRDVKQAAMQQLLTGRTRLAGFSEKWEEASIGELARLLKGRGLSRAAVREDGVHPCLLYGELFTTYGRVAREVVGRTDSDDGELSLFGDVLMPGSTTTSGADLATATALLVSDVRLGGDVNVIRPNLEQTDPRWLAHVITSCHRSTIATLAQGITIHHLYGKDIASLVIHLPSRQEQAALADLLDDIEAEVEALVAQREKMRLVKQGMMQELLSGRVRLV